jgi:hypothetical protein
LSLRLVPLERGTLRRPALTDYRRHFLVGHRIDENEGLAAETVQILLDDTADEQRRDARVEGVAALRRVSNAAADVSGCPADTPADEPMIGGRIPPTIGSGAPGLGGVAGARRPPPPCSSCAATLLVVRLATARQRKSKGKAQSNAFHVCSLPADATWN